MKKILIVEDDMDVASELAALLENSDYQPMIFTDFEHSKTELVKIECDLILMDIQIPGINGEMLLKEIRRTSNVPVIMVTSRTSETDEVLSMSYGADDYISKPYNPTILLLHIQAILKRLEGNCDSIAYYDLIVKPQRGTIIKGTMEQSLTKNEMMIFVYLLNHRQRIVTRDELMTDLWNNNEYINDNALTVNISRLRSKLKEIGYEDAIETKKGQGYLLV